MSSQVKINPGQAFLFPSVTTGSFSGLSLRLLKLGCFTVFTLEPDTSVVQSIIFDQIVKYIYGKDYKPNKETHRGADEHVICPSTRILTLLLFFHFSPWFKFCFLGFPNYFSSYSKLYLKDFLGEAS